MMLDPITFPAREESRITKVYKAIGAFETKHPHLTMYLVWAAFGVAMLASWLVKP